VDLWDLTRLLFRRWYVAVPMLLVSLASVAVISQTVPPDYSATGHVTMIPPNDRSAATPAKVQNPWEELGFRALGQAVIIKLADQKVLEDLVKEGFTDNFTVWMDDRTPLFTIESVGTTPEQAISTTRKIMKIIEDDVVARQTRYGVAGGDLITTLALDNGDTVVKITSKATRVLLVATALGVLLSAATTIAIDAILRRRARRSSLAAVSAQAVEPIEEVKPLAPIRAKGKAKIARQPESNGVKPATGKATGKATAASRAPVMVKYIDVESMETIGIDAATERVPPEDATIVLPLYGAKRPTADDKGRRD
jgi:hypothetical protein